MHWSPIFLTHRRRMYHLTYSPTFQLPGRHHRRRRRVLLRVRYGGYGYMNSSEGLPANKPAWSTLTAYDLNKGTIKWQIPLGSVTELVR